MKFYPLLLLLLVAASNSMQASERPNIVLIVADDLGYGDLACYGNRLNQTPAIDRLAARGLRCTDFHSNGSMCTPTRVAMLTGLYQHRFGKKFDGPLSGKETRDHGLPLAAVTCAEALRKHGYATGMFGKWHLGYIPPWLPPSQGFDEFRGLGAGDGDHHTHIDRWGREDWWHNNALDMTTGYTADLLTQYSIEFIEQHQHEPFFLYVPHLAIHFPWQGPNDPPHRKKGGDYDNDKWGIIPDPSHVQPHIKAMVESVDQSVGQIVATLERLKLSDNTLVLITSDNGGYLNYGEKFHDISSNGPLRGQKGTIYEGGHRVPMIFFWPGKIAPGVTDATAMSIDLFPSFATLAGFNTEGMQLDGVDLVPHLMDGQKLARRTLFWREDIEHAVRRGPWKLCVNGKQVELFDLDKDLGETKDLSRQQPALVQSLVAAWAKWESGVNESAKAFGE
jgi:arylsulfatase A